MFHIVLYEPEIPPNTGNIIRLCANAGAKLHLIKPLGFSLEDAKLKRAGLDYRELADIKIHDSLDHFLAAVKPLNVYGCSTKGKIRYSDVAFNKDDALLFGPESRGLPPKVIAGLTPNYLITIPMHPGSRSLNLANAVSIVLYEAWRQLGFS